jgi:hypothetical protein
VDEVDHDPGARPRLPGARRPPDEQIAVVERRRMLPLLNEIHRLEGPVEAAGQPGRRPGEDVAQGPIATIVREYRGAETRQGSTLLRRLDRPRRDQRLRQGRRRQARTTAQEQHASVVVESLDRAGALSGMAGSHGASPSLSLCCWASKRNRYSIEQFTARGTPSGRRRPIASPSSTSSSADIWPRSKNHHHAGRASRR